MVVQIAIPVAEVNRLLGLGFTRAEVWRSSDQGASYQEVTASAPTSASLSSLDAATLFRLGGKLLKFQIDGAAEVAVSFDALVDFWTPTQAVTRINQVATGVASVDGNHIKLSSSTTGRTSSVVITYNDADDLGFVVGQTSIGQDGRIVLLTDTVIYFYNDVAGSLDDRYKWRFSADGLPPISDFADRIFPSPPPVTGVDLSVGSARFVNLDGTARKTRVIVVPDADPANIAGFVVGTDAPLVVDADEDGLVQLVLVRGAKVRVAFEGSTFVREFTVPAQPSFDLLAVMAAAPDPFTVQVPPPFLTRRSI